MCGQTHKNIATAGHGLATSASTPKFPTIQFTPMGDFVLLASLFLHIHIDLTGSPLTLEKGEARHRKYMGLKLCGSQEYDR
jgi:hypothetical protein